MIVEPGDEIPGRRQVEPSPAKVAAPVLGDAVELPDPGAVDEAERRKIVRANLLEARFNAQRLVGKIERRAKGTVIALGVGKAAHIEKVGLQNGAWSEVGVAVLEIHAGKRVLRTACGIPIGEHESEL